MKRRSLSLTAMLLVLTFWLGLDCASADAASASPAAGTVLSYAVVEARTRKPLYTLRGWNEVASADSSHVVAASTLIFPQGNTADIRVTFTHDEPPQCVSWEAEVKDAAGALIATSRERFVPAAFPLLSEAVPPDTYPPLAPLGYVLTRLGLGQRRQRASFHFILMGTSLLQMDLWLDGREAIDVPAGRFDCYRVRMRVNPSSLFPNLPGFLQPFVRFFIPTHTIWLTAGEPQALVKYTGQMGPPGSPELLIELTNVARDGR